MAKTETKNPAPKEEPRGHYDGTPGARRNQQMTTWKEFEGGLQEREADIASMLPQHVSKARFMSSAVAAVKQNPDLLKASARSLFSAVTKSAQDGILPDGREGVITAYAGEAKWNPMAYGLRKRARELDGILIDAQVVCANDTFVWHQGDEPHIEHQPAELGQPRGEKIGAYAIFKREDGTVLHREVMDRDQIEAVKSISKATNSLMWTKFEEEGWRKTVVRRGIKSVPCSEKLDQIVRRNDEDFDMANVPENIHLVGTARPKREDFIEGTAKTAEIVVPDGGEPVAEEQTSTEMADVDHGGEDFVGSPEWLADQYEALKACKTEDQVMELRQAVMFDLASNKAEVEKWKTACADRATEVFKA